MRHDPDTLTTGEIACLLRCGVQQVARILDRGLIPSWRVPGTSRHRRARRADVVEFARQNNIPLGDIKR